MRELPESPSDLSQILAISMSYAYALKNQSRPWTTPLAITYFQKTGMKVGPIADYTDDDIAVLARHEGLAA